MTLKEIAQKANVSISTVSRVINQKNTKAASPEVQERIWEIVRESGYTPNTSARALKMGTKAPESPLCRKRFPVFTQEEKPQFPTFFSRILPRPLSRKLLKATFSSNILSLLLILPMRRLPPG